MPGCGHGPEELARRYAAPGGASWRLIVPPGHFEPFEDLVSRGAGIPRPLDETVGDFVLRRRDGVIAYQLAVVVDDLAAGVSHVIRGQDLYPSTERQRYLWRLLAGPSGPPPPVYGHIGLCLSSAGEKLSKRDGPLALSALRARGLSAGQVLGLLAPTLGMQDLGPGALARDYVSLWPGLTPALEADVFMGDLGNLT